MNSTFLKHSLFLDDERDPLDVHWIQYPNSSRFFQKNVSKEYKHIHISRNFKDFVDYVKNNIKTPQDLESFEITFDHDLGDYYYYSTFENFIQLVDIFNQLGNVFIKDSDKSLISFEKLIEEKNKNLEFSTLDSFIAYLREHKNYLIQEIKQYCDKDDFYKDDVKFFQDFSQKLIDLIENKQKLFNTIKKIEEQKGFKFDSKNSFGDFLEFAILFHKYKKSNNELTGASCLEFFCNYLLDNKDIFKEANILNLKTHFKFHSMNLDRREYMEYYLLNFIHHFN